MARHSEHTRGKVRPHWLAEWSNRTPYQGVCRHEYGTSVSDLLTREAALRNDDGQQYTYLAGERDKAS
jgi:hypothetical protein